MSALLDLPSPKAEPPEPASQDAEPPELNFLGSFVGAWPRSSESPHPALKPLTLADKAIFDAHAAIQKVPLADYSFANNFCWQGPQQFFYAVLADCFCLFTRRGAVLALAIPPLGPSERTAQAMAAAFALLVEVNGPELPSVICYVAPQILAVVERWPSQDLPPGALRVEPGLVDYVYRRQDLLDMQGGRYHGKRKEISHLLKSGAKVDLSPISTAQIPELGALLRRWIARRVEEHGAHSQIAQYAREEAIAIYRALLDYEELSLSGLVLRVNDAVEGFTVAETLTPGVANILFEKTNLSIKGLAPYLFREMCRVMADCPTINTGEDLALPSLRYAKMSYGPSVLLQKFNLVWTGDVRG